MGEEIFVKLRNEGEKKSNVTRAFLEGLKFRNSFFPSGTRTSVVY